MTYRNLRLESSSGVPSLSVDGDDVRVISNRTLREFWEGRKTDSEVAERFLVAWRKVVEHAGWNNFSSLKQTFGSADQVGNCVVFDVGNNRFRLIGRVNYAKGIVYVLKVMDHVEYDRKRWVEDCGCHNPPPKHPATVKNSTPRRKPSHPKRMKER